MIIAIIVIGVVAVLIAVVLLLAASKPDTFRVERSARIKAAPEKIGELISDFHKWPLWSPFEKYDPNVERAYAGLERGRGAIYEWKGNDKAGAGRMEIMESSPKGVVIKLDFSKPFVAHNTARFEMSPDG